MASWIVPWLNNLLDHNGESQQTTNAKDFEKLLEKHRQEKTLAPYFVTPEICNEYKDTVSELGFSLFDALQAGLADSKKNLHNIGFLAADAHAYNLYQKVLKPLIASINLINPRTVRVNIYSRKFDVGKLRNLENLDTSYIECCRVRVLRSLRRFPFSWSCNESQRRKVEEIVKSAFSKLKESQTSYYIRLSDHSQEARLKLMKKHCIFTRNVDTADPAWTTGRSLLCGSVGSPVIVVNEAEHIKVIIQKKGADVFSAFRKLYDFLEKLERLLSEDGHEFAFDDYYGYLTSSPRETGTGLRVSVIVKLPLLAKDQRFPFILHRLLLEDNILGFGIYNVLELSNYRRADGNEVDILHAFLSSVHCLISMEKLLENGYKIDSILPKLFINTGPGRTRA